LLTDFVNLKIKPTQSFKCVYMDRVYVHVFIEMSNYTCMNIYIYNVFLKTIISATSHGPKFSLMVLCHILSSLSFLC
jgi:hypothetical protein